MTVTLKEATPNDIDLIVDFLEKMNEETKDFHFNASIFKRAVQDSFKENVHWFLFIDENEKPFGLCHCQSVFSYWQVEKRFYLGGFYITPPHRKQGYFKTLNKQLKQWATDNNGVEIYAHINKENTHSKRSFESVDFEKIDYDLHMNYWGKPF